MSESGFTSQKLNLTLALCAILISAASFYATYLQANAAEKQVKAMTLPLIQTATGNVDAKTKEKTIYFEVENAGVGPALIKSISYFYKGKEFQTHAAFIKACCSKELAHLRKIGVNNGYVTLTSAVINNIIPAQSKVKYFQLFHNDSMNEYWEKLNDERFNIQTKVCYCSLLEECYITEKNGVVEPVAACPVD